MSGFVARSTVVEGQEPWPEGAVCLEYQAMPEGAVVASLSWYMSPAQALSLAEKLRASAEKASAAGVVCSRCFGERTIQTATAGPADCHVCKGSGVEAQP